MTAIYAVAGNPVFGSRSPLMFNAAFRELAIDAAYVRLAASNASEIMATARQAGIAGLNITTPFKADIMAHLDGIDADAKGAGAVNTVVKGPDGYVGYNTDVAGLLGALGAAGFNPSEKKAVILGAGGAARAAALGLLRAGATVVIVNRTLARARDGAGKLGCEAVPLSGLAGALEGARLLVSAISSTGRVVDPTLLTPDIFVLDALYSRPTALVKDATDKGCRVIDGREWLLAQAAPAFSLFLGRPAPLDIMRKALWKRRLDSRKNIALIGFMGAGKSVVGAELARVSGLTFTDIDRQIEENAGATIPEIFEREGEGAFRRMEQEEIDGLRLTSRLVAACGGGALETRANVRTLRNNCLSVWLWADVPTVIERAGGVTGRPLFDGLGAEAVRDLLALRLPGYARCADLVISTEGKGPAEIAGRIWDEVRSAFDD